MHHLEVPIEMPGWYVDVSGVSLSRGSDSGAYRVGVLVQPAGAPQLAEHLYLTLTDAAFLRDAIDEALQAYHVRQGCAN